jgi:hypothetical protein
MLKKCALKETWQPLSSLNFSPQKRNCIVGLFTMLKIFYKRLRLVARSEENFGQHLADLTQVSCTYFLSF